MSEADHSSGFREPSEPCDPLDLAARRWVAKARTAADAWRITEKLGLDPELAQRVQDAADADEGDEYWEALADFFEPAAGELKAGKKPTEPRRRAGEQREDRRPTERLRGGAALSPAAPPSNFAGEPRGSFLRACAWPRRGGGWGRGRGPYSARTWPGQAARNRSGGL